MRCPFCEYNGTRVLDSRPFNNNKSIRRRRECEECGKRFTTFEMIEETPLLIVKKDGTREEYSRDKILRGLIRACEKRPVSLDELEEIVSEIERDLRSQARSEIPSKEIGEMVMERLYYVDEVAYVRFASVYRQFKDINVFMKELEELLDDARSNPEKLLKASKVVDSDTSDTE
ncbi:transcriptional regulator NrdR [Brevibacillus daliensis]|uniref:transcriptional regulator NrdR n=1 Tax=Brevibacillus daliensis TaxID=2892995 RepID=UPI001E530A99|nr:transcriptional regulator NrdR [Brevibacillus daliensis]